MRSTYPISQIDQLIEDLSADEFQFSNITIDSLSKFLHTAGNENSLMKLALSFSDKAEGVLAFRRIQEAYSVILTAHNAATGISFVHDNKHFPKTPDYTQLVNYLAGKAILISRLNKEGILGEFFIQGIPEHFDRNKIKHLKLHPKQTYLMVSNNYLKMEPGSENFKIGGRSITELQYASLKKGNTMIIHNPWFFVSKQGQAGKVEKINLYGKYSFAIDLLKKGYKNIDCIKPSIEPEFLPKNITHFVEHVSKMIGEKAFEEKLMLGMENAYASKKEDWNNLFNHLLYAANTAYIKDPKDTKAYIYPFQQHGYAITTSLTEKTIHLHPQGLPHNSPVSIEITDPIKVLDSLLKSQQISETVYDLSIEQLNNKQNQGLKI